MDPNSTNEEMDLTGSLARLTPSISVVVVLTVVLLLGAFWPPQPLGLGGSFDSLNKERIVADDDIKRRRPVE